MSSKYVHLIAWFREAEMYEFILVVLSVAGWQGQPLLRHLSYFLDQLPFCQELEYMDFQWTGRAIPVYVFGE